MREQKKYWGLFDKLLTLATGAKNEPEKTPGKKDRVSIKLKRNYHFRIELDLDNLKSAIDAARIPEFPNREMLYVIYDLVSKDSHLASQMRTAKQAVQQSDFVLLRNGKPDEKLGEMFKTEWFDSFINYVLDAEFWGHSLIEFGQLVNKSFDDCKLIPRLNVVPEHGIVVMQPGDMRGIDYRKALTQFALIEVGDPYSLGILELAAKEVIVKNYARTDWSLSSEKYGMPMLKIMTESQDSDEIDKMESQAANFANNGYIILNKNDEAEIIADSNTDRYKIYQENINVCDAQISKLINGQTGTSDEKAFVGSAEVHERILNDYTFARLRRAQHIINNKLIPFLTWWGYPFIEGDKFVYIDLIKKPEQKDKSSIDQETKEDIEKKKLSQSSAFSHPGEMSKGQRGLPDWVLNM